MTESTLQSAGGFLSMFEGRLNALGGTCTTHGASSVLVRIGLPWNCPKCLEIQMKEEAHELWKTERNASLMLNATIPKKYIGQRFAATTPAQVAVRHAVRGFRDFILREPQWAALIMVGITGTGKTLLACEFAQSLIKNASRSVRYITAKGMIGEIQASYGREGKSEEGEIMRFAQYDVLILDELDAIPAKDNASLLLTEIINRRYNENKPVVVISNQPLEGLAKFVGDRVHSRLHENAFSCAFTWADFRKGPQT